MQQLAPLHSVVETLAENATGAARTSVLLPNVLISSFLIGQKPLYLQNLDSVKNNKTIGKHTNYKRTKIIAIQVER